jgi:hypothetical protein
MKKFLTEAFYKGLARYVYDELIYKYADEYVKKTDNSYDDSALLFLDGLIDDFLKEDDA